MRSKAPLLPGRRARTSRIARRVLVGVVILIIGLLALLSYMIFHSLGDGEGAFTPDGGNTNHHNNLASKLSTTSPSGGLSGNPLGGDAAGHSAAATSAETMMPYTESLDELIELLQLYAHTRGVNVNESILKSYGINDHHHHKNNEGGNGGAKQLPEELQLAGMHELRANTPAGPDGAGLHTEWMLDDPATIQAEQESYAERFISPVQRDVPLTPLRVLSAYYDPQSPRGLHHLAAAVEKSMNDDGYATYIQRSVTFFDPSHAARRGYGVEGSIFVAVPFTLRDITPDMVAAIAARATAPLFVAGRDAAAHRHPLDGADDAAAAQDVDGFREIHRTAALCAATVESVFRQAHHGIGVTVGTVDVVIASGLRAAEEVDLAMPAEVRRPITEEARVNISASRKRRYDRVTCEPPNFRSGWADASYGFSWKDNLRQRRVLIPLTQLTKSGEAGGVQEGRSAAAAAARALPHVGRYATLELYRGESYVFLLSPGSLAMPNWDLKLRLLYLRTPQHQRAVLSSRPSPGVVWQSLAAAVVKEWMQQPYLSFSSLAGTSSTTVKGPQAGANEGNNKNNNTNNRNDIGGPQQLQSVPPLDWTGKRLLQTFPEKVAAWLSEARADAALGLWLVTPRWLWPVLMDAVQEWRQLSSHAAPTQKPLPGSAAARRTPSLRDVLSDGALKEILGDAAGLEALQLDSVAVTSPSSPSTAAAAAGTNGEKAAQVRGAGPTTRTPQPILLSSLTESEVYKLLFLVEKRAPLPNEPITDMRKLMDARNESDAAQGAGDTPAGNNPHQANKGGNAGGAAAATTGLVTCGTAGMPLAYVAPHDKDVLVKRAFEYCWLVQHRSALRKLAERLTHAADAMSVLTTFVANSKPDEKKAKLTAGAGAGCGEATTESDEGRKLQWYDTMLRPAQEASACLADMRYLDPSETPLLGADNQNSNNKAGEAALDARGVTRSAAAEVERWLTSAQNAGQLRGQSHAQVLELASKHAVEMLAEEKAAGTAQDGTTTTTTTTMIANTAAATTTTSTTRTKTAPTTSYVLQSVASADFLFGPAEAFFDIAPEDRLRTRGDSLATQLEKKTAHQNTVVQATEGGAGLQHPSSVAASTSSYATTPEPIELDPTLHYLDRGALDLYLTTALWTRGWNIFGVTEAVVAGREPPTVPASTENGAEVCGLTEPAAAEAQQQQQQQQLPAVVAAARAFAEEKFWALVAAHRAAGTPLGPVHAGAEDAKTAQARFPLRRTLQAYEAFANVKLDDLKSKKR